MKTLRFVLPTSFLCLALTASRGFAADAPVASAAAAPSGEITAALPVIPDAKFNIKDYGGVGDFKTDNTEAFHKAVAAIEAAGGGHLIVPEGLYKTKPFQLTSHMDLHLEAGAVIKAPETFTDYGIPDPNDAYINGTPYQGGRVAPLISGNSNNMTDVAITGTGTIDGSGKEFWRWSDKDNRLYPAGRPTVGRPVLVSLTGNRIHVDGVTLTNISFLMARTSPSKTFTSSPPATPPTLTPWTPAASALSSATAKLTRVTTTAPSSKALRMFSSKA